jgi:mannose-1-phosphate guanylyltransferase
MQLVIIAGGLGTRLRPLTYARPKALVPLLNRPQILHLFERLPPAIDEVLVAVNYRFEQVKAFFESVDLGRDVTVVHESVPLGTAGALKNVAGKIDGTFAAFNGDVVDTLDIGELLRFHAERRRRGTITVAPVADPSAFGVVAVEGDRAVRFVEKPPRDEAPSNLVNAGRYVFEPDVLDLIEPGREVSLEREVFPRLVKEGLSVFRHDGPWSDAGTLQSYLRAQALLLDASGGGVAADAEVTRATIRGPVLVGPAAFAEGEVGPHAVLARGCRLGRARVSECALFDGVSVDDKADVSRSIVGESASIGEGAVVRGSIVGDGVHVAPHAKLVGESVAA